MHCVWNRESPNIYIYIKQFISSLFLCNILSLLWVCDFLFYFKRILRRVLWCFTLCLFSHLFDFLPVQISFTCVLLSALSCLVCVLPSSFVNHLCLFKHSSPFSFLPDFWGAGFFFLPWICFCTYLDLFALCKVAPLFLTAVCLLPPLVYLFV